MEKIRTFVAVPVPSPTRQAMSAVQSELIDAGSDVKWELADKFHITLKFLGDTSTSTILSLEQSLRKSICSLPSFDVVYSGLGAFPSLERPRILWIGTQHSPELHRVQQVVDAQCIALGVPKEERPFHAHITLGRVKGTRGVDRLTAKLKSVTFQAVTTRCTEIHIMRSDLKPTGSVFTLLHTIPLAS